MARQVEGWSVLRGEVPEGLHDALRDPAGLLDAPGGVLLREGNSRRTVALPRAGAVVKWHFRIGSRAKWRALRQPGEACVEYDAAVRVLESGVPTARPLFAAERRRLGLLQSALIGYEYVPTATDLEKLVDVHGCDARPAVDTERGLELLSKVGRELARVHAAGIAHNDLHADNVLIQEPDGQARVLFIDWLKADFCPADQEAARRRDLRTLLLSMILRGTAVRRMRALYSAYADEAGWSRVQRRETKCRLTENIRSRVLHLIERTGRNALRKSRRVRRARFGGLRIYCVKALHPQDVAATFAASGRTSMRPLGAGEPLPGMEVIPAPQAAETWRAARVAHRFRLPCRRTAAIALRRWREAGWLIVDAAEGVPLRQLLTGEEAGPDLLGRLRHLARILHRCGLRFVRCEQGDIRRVGPSESLAACTGGLWVHDPRVLRLRPGAGTEESWRVLTDYVRSAAGQQVLARLPALR